MELIDTIDLMTSDDYKDRFMAEYYQVKIRYQKLKSILDKYEEGTLDFEPSCSISLLMIQREIMEDTNGNRKLLKRRYEAKIDAVAALMDAWVAYKINRDAYE